MGPIFRETGRWGGECHWGQFFGGEAALRPLDFPSESPVLDLLFPALHLGVGKTGVGAVLTQPTQPPSPGPSVRPSVRSPS